MRYFKEMTAMVGRFALVLRPLGLVALITTLMATTLAAQSVSTPTVWSWLGIPAGLHHKVRDALVNRHGFFPGLERRPKLLRIADPELAAIDNPAIKKAQQIKAEEDLAPQKIKAVKYLAKLGCGGCYKGVDEALLEAAKDCTESVRHATVKAIGGTRNKKCPQCDNHCCGEKIIEQLAKIAYERDEEHPDCWYEPSERVRKAAKAALKACCPGNTPPRLLRVEDEPKLQSPEPESPKPSDPEPSDPEPQPRPNTTTKTKPAPPVELAFVLLTAMAADPPAKTSDPDRPVTLRRSDDSNDDPAPRPAISNPSPAPDKRPVTGLVWKTTSRGASPTTVHTVKGRQSSGEKSVVVRLVSAQQPVATKRPVARQASRTSNLICAKCSQQHAPRSTLKKARPRSLYEAFFAPRILTKSTVR